MDQVIKIALQLLELISYLAIIAASGVAVWGINAWRREHVGKRRIELAEQSLAIVYEIQETLRRIRSIGVRVGEGSTRPRKEDESDEERAALDEGYALYERFEPYRELFGKLRAVRYRFKATFRVKAAEPFDELLEVESKMFRAASKLAFWARDYRSPGGQHSQQALEDLQRCRLILWGYGGEGDEIFNDVVRIVQRVEDFCGPMLKI
ncbi:MAG: hypothetical protein KKG33_03375 [candidate division Zixibacteria bacterium]|nr:hypothetical protein [candidate division Zixibacteria bacterium]MBU1470922.1 hypothetical protein [candidate division Zixibacteria bacterium]MBU2624584.1 hypothetical protein [candidate division Zixibacteria bacterium]